MTPHSRHASIRGTTKARTVWTKTSNLIGVVSLTSVGLLPTLQYKPPTLHYILCKAHILMLSMSRDPTSHKAPSLRPAGRSIPGRPKCATSSTTPCRCMVFYLTPAPVLPRTPGPTPSPLHLELFYLSIGSDWRYAATLRDYKKIFLPSLQSSGVHPHTLHSKRTALRNRFKALGQARRLLSLFPRKKYHHASTSTTYGTRRVDTP